MAGVKENTLTNISSGNVASFKSVGIVPLKSLKVNFNPIQEGEGYPSPDNVRPITGWTGINLYHSGKNLVEVSSENRCVNSNLNNFSEENNIITIYVNFAKKLH